MERFVETALTRTEFVAEVDRGGAYRLIFYDPLPGWLMVVEMIDGRTGVLFTTERTATVPHRRVFKSVNAIRQVERAFRIVPQRTLLPWVPDRSFPYDKERRARLQILT